MNGCVEIVLTDNNSMNGFKGIVAIYIYISIRYIDYMALV